MQRSWLPFSGWPGVSRASFSSMRVRGKVLGYLAQSIINYGVKLAEYFASAVGKLAKWQRTPAPSAGRGSPAAVSPARWKVDAKQVAGSVRQVCADAPLP